MENCPGGILPSPCDSCDGLQWSSEARVQDEQLQERGGRLIPQKVQSTTTASTQDLQHFSPISVCSEQEGDISLGIRLRRSVHLVIGGIKRIFCGENLSLKRRLVFAIHQRISHMTTDVVIAGEHLSVCPPSGNLSPRCPD